MEEAKSLWPKIKELWKNKRTRGILFFVFYFFFFGFLVLLLQNAPEKENNGPPVVTGEYSFYKLDQDNYHFSYTVSENAATVLFEGKKNKSNSSFTKEIDGLKENYFFTNEKYYVLKGNAYQVTKNPY